VQELLDIANPRSEISNATTKIVKLRLHAIQAAFYRREPLLRCGVGIITVCWRQAANEMVLLSVLTGAAQEVRYALCIACVADKEVI